MKDDHESILSMNDKLGDDGQKINFHYINDKIGGDG
jgi:hypothetical protein